MSHSLKRLIVGGLAGGLALSSITVVPGQAAEVVTHGCIESVPEPGTTDPVKICYTLFQPASASASSPVPLIFHSHGWGGSRTRTASGSVAAFLSDGYGVLSFDQRSFGDSGGKAHVEHPDYEGQDVTRLVDLVAGLDWVKKDAPGDPVIGAVGGSYGGGYQFVGAFTDMMKRGDGTTRFNALAPEITWHDLQDSLAPQKVPRTVWNTLLFAAGTDSHTDTVVKGFAYGATTGNWAEGEIPGVNLTEFFRQTGPKWHADNGRQLNIPVLFGQGINDTLFNLNQAVHNFQRALTPAAQAQSMVVGYHGGHVLTASAYPAGNHPSNSDQCSNALGGGSFQTLARKFYAEELKGAPRTLAGRGKYHLATPQGSCVTVDSVTADTAVSVGTIATNTGHGAPQYVKVADGPITVAGMPTLDATVTSAAYDARAFVALAVGTSPLDAKTVQNQMLPVREALPVVGASRTFELPGVSVQVPAGQSLYLAVSPTYDMVFGHGSKAPGVLLFENAKVNLPVV